MWPIAHACRTTLRFAENLGGLRIEQNRAKPSGLTLFSLAWQRPTFPVPLETSILGAGGLHVRVRDGYGCFPSAMVTRPIFCFASLRLFLAHTASAFGLQMCSLGPNSACRWFMTL